MSAPEPPPVRPQPFRFGHGGAVGESGKTFDEAAREYLRRQEMYGDDHGTAHYNVRVLLRFFSGRRLDEIGPREIEAMMTARLEEPVSKPTVNRNLACLSKIMRTSWDGPNPVRRVQKFAENPGRFRFLDQHEAARLINAAEPGHLKLFIIAALQTGARRGELLRLRWRDVDFGRRMITFRKETTKSRRQRHVPLTRSLEFALRMEGPGPQDDLIFTWGGRPITTVRTAFEHARRIAGLGKDVTVHTLRHTFCTGFMERGGKLEDLADLVGHCDLKSTRRYTHFSPGRRARSLALIGPPKGA